MGAERKARLEELDRKVQIPWNSFEERKVLRQELMDIEATKQQEPFDYEEHNKFAFIILSLFARNYEFVNKVVSGEKQLKDSELEELEKNLKVLPEVAEGFESQAKFYKTIGLNSAADAQIKMKKSVEGGYKNALTDAIQRENSRRQQKQNNSQINQLRDLLNQILNKTQSLNQKNSYKTSDLKEIQKQLNTLQSQVQNLENNPSTSQSPMSQNYKEELIKLKDQIKQLQSDLANKEKDDQKPANGSQQPQQFNWLYVVIPGAILLVLMGIVIVYLVGKNKKSSKV